MYILKNNKHYSENPLSEQSRYKMECKFKKLLSKAEEIAAETINVNRKAFDEIVKRLTENKILSREELLKINAA